MSDLAETARRIARREGRLPVADLHRRVMALASDPQSRWLSVQKVAGPIWFMQLARLHAGPDAGEGKRRRRTPPRPKSSRGRGGETRVDGARADAGVDDRKRKDRP